MSPLTHHFALSRFTLCLALFAGAAALPACAAQSDDPSAADEEADLTGTDTAIVTLANASKSRIYVAFNAKSSSNVGDALVAAAKRGVDARAILDASGDHDATWTLQQHLESSGVDVDVRNDLVTGIIAVGDDTALLPGSKTTQVTDATKVAAFAKKFTDVLEPDATSTRGTLIASGAVDVHPMPESGRDRIVELIGAAKTTIDLEIYQLQDRPVVEALVAAAHNHVTVRVMLEPKTVGAANYTQVAATLQAAGVTVKTTPKAFDSSHNVDHAKFCLLDDKELIFGTGNMVRSGLGGDEDTTYDNRDFWIEDARPAALKEARALFDADWTESSTSHMTFDTLVVTPDNADDKIGALIDGAKHRLYVANQSLADSDIEAKLAAAKKRGVDVRVQLGYQPPFGGGGSPNDPAIATLTASGVAAAYLKKHYLHAKYIVADDTVYLGSQNFTNGGLKDNREVGEILNDAKVVSTVAATFEKDAQ
jgi:phosphatidylserine/phosphatidylglycerophosphate/cardiolipin synthase-like enzyme